MIGCNCFFLRRCALNNVARVVVLSKNYHLLCWCQGQALARDGTSHSSSGKTSVDFNEEDIDTYNRFINNVQRNKGTK